MEDTKVAQAEEYERRRLEAVNMYRAEALQKRRDLIASGQQERAKEAASEPPPKKEEAEERESDQEAKRTQPLDKATEGGSEVLGAVGGTFADIGENMMKPAAEKVGQEGKGGGGGVLGATGGVLGATGENRSRNSRDK